MLTITIDDKGVMTLLEDLRAKTSNLKPVMALIAEDMETAVSKNFEQGGRPTAWKRSKRAAQEGGQTLVKSGRLKNSITSRFTSRSAEVGTNVKYAAIHHFGGDIKHPAHPLIFKKYARGAKKGRSFFAKNSSSYNRGAYGIMGKPYTIKMPARPFMVIPDDDLQKIRDAIASFMTGV